MYLISQERKLTKSMVTTPVRCEVKVQESCARGGAYSIKCLLRYRLKASRLENDMLFLNMPVKDYISVNFE